MLCVVSIKPPGLAACRDEGVEIPYGDLWLEGRDKAAVECIVLVS